MRPAPGLGRRLRGLLHPVLARAAATPGADRSRKHFPASAHVWILLRHVLCGGDSLRQTHAELTGELGAFARLGLPQGISRAQLARSSTSRPAACFEALFAAVLTRARTRHQRDPQLAALQRVQVVDSSFLRLSAKLSPWSCHGKQAPGVRLQTGFDLAGSVPSALCLTLTDTHDTTALSTRDLTHLAGWTVLIDLGYYGHRLFVQLRAARVSFICRLHPQAFVVTTAVHPVDPTPTADGDTVCGDATITLGSPNNRAGAVLPAMRLITSQNADGTAQRFVTDRFDLTADAVLALYRQRWQMELFFRWLKHQLKALHPFGTSREAVWLTVLVSATVAALAGLVETARPKGDTRIAWLRAVGRTLVTAPTRSTTLPATPPNGPG